ncbi:hypothetical protein GCM10011581_09640 [Saccharopolyspora subtropica]|uniref:Uncharacterized protein n=1 Tax=Saccharopolyspora thermophila TaxID=89367 RepID=A0A917JM23_9PSEU|nr:hypothetical protein GCM10011581_09640 [Saccharopolyspora subtropica]
MGWRIGGRRRAGAAGAGCRWIGERSPTHRYPECLADSPWRLVCDPLANTGMPMVLWALRDEPSRPVDLRRRLGGIRRKG